MKIRKSEKFTKIVYWVVRIISISMIALCIIALIIDYHKLTRPDSRYVFIIVQASAMLTLTFVPRLLMKIWKIRCPIVIELIFLGFCSCAIIFGEIFEFYILFEWWDDLLHTFSGGFIALIGYIIINIFNQKENVNLKLSPGFVACFAFFLAMGCEALWEAFEWTMDSLFGSNMQRYMHNITNEPFLGRAALEDTMSDIIEVMFGSIIIIVLGYLDMKFNENKIINFFRIKKVDDNLLNNENNEKKL